MAARYCTNNEMFVDSSDEESGNDDDEDLYEEALDWSGIKKLEDLPWFHSGISRNTAEAMLLQNGKEGTYLMRCSTHSEGKMTVSVKCHNSVKHYTLEYNPYTKCYMFGQGQFNLLSELLDHFNSRPVLISESGFQVILTQPYMNNVEEPDTYVKVNTHGEGCRGKGMLQENPDFHIASKEGYLVKRGAIHKNWKRRWFVLNKDTLKYFNQKDSSEPIRIINLKCAVGVYNISIDDKQYCFSLILPNRTFYFQATCEEEVEKWKNMLQWKINHYTKEK